ncbi:MAG TPA: hypothetical protein VLM37_06015 [Fibrobacteraceae bacterium]|nr:hypothetical protein [Fibrobacteraceae bacterium]
MPIILFLYGVLPAVQIFAFLQGRAAYNVSDAVNYSSSILLFHWVLANVLLASKIPWFQRLVPYDARVRLHILASAGIALALSFHVTYKILMGKWIDLVSWSLLAMMAVLLFLAVLWVPIPGFRAFRHLVHSWLGSLSYDRSKKIHSFILIFATVLILLHVAQADLFSQVPPWSAIFYLALYLSALAGHLIARVGLFRTKATVIRTERRRDIVVLYLHPHRSFHFRSGQFAFLRVKLPSHKMEEHPFSILSTPQEPVITLAIRALGDFTKDLEHLPPGSQVSLNGGYGNFYPRGESPLCFIASGIGMVPCISILKSLQESRESRPILFFLAVHDLEGLPERERLEAIPRDLPNVHLRILTSNPPGPRFGKTFFQHEIPDPRSFSYFLCSSSKVRQTVIQALHALGVQNRVIHYETFTLG